MIFLSENNTNKGFSSVILYLNKNFVKSFKGNCWDIFKLETNPLLIFFNNCVHL